MNYYNTKAQIEAMRPNNKMLAFVHQTGVLYYFDSTSTRTANGTTVLIAAIAGRWLAENPFVKTWAFSASRNSAAVTSDQDLRREDSAPTNVMPYIIPIQCELKYITATSRSGASSWVAEVFKNDVLAADLLSDSNTVSPLLDVQCVSGDEIRLRFNKIAININRPSINAFFSEL